ncbi:MAG: quaternary ammonium transporter [Candidatus Eremiobacteraeota bacterium]|nr:quaternary ammonium transporter [Candidatus Eremiobacteraeota bacterium]
MQLSRARALGLIGAALTGCGSRTAAVRVGSKNFSEQLFLGELYAQVLEKRGLSVERKLSLGSTQIAMAAMQRGELDLYPEYTGTALLVVLKAPVAYDSRRVYETVKREFEQRYKIAWLEPSPFNDTQALASTKEIAARYGLRTLSDVSRAAPQLRLAVTAEFVSRPDGLPALQKTYGGFRFKDVRQIDIGLRYQALLDKRADVCVAFSTDGEILQYGLTVFDDDKHAFPPYQVAPIVRDEALQRTPAIAEALNKLAPLLDDATIRGVNLAISGPQKREPADVAREFIAKHGLG